MQVSPKKNLSNQRTPYQGIYSFIRSLTSPNVKDFFLLLLQRPALYLLKPFSRTLCPMTSRNSLNAGPPSSLLYISSSVCWPALQYITPTLTEGAACLVRCLYKWRSLDVTLYVFSLHCSSSRTSCSSHGPDWIPRWRLHKINQNQWQNIMFTGHSFLTGWHKIGNIQNWRKNIWMLKPHTICLCMNLKSLPIMLVTWMNISVVRFI